MRIFHIGSERFADLNDLPRTLPDAGFIWVSTERDEFAQHRADVQAALQRWTGGQLVDLHISDLLNTQLPSQYEYTSWYDLMVFHRLAAGDTAPPADGAAAPQPATQPATQPTAAPAKPVLTAVDTSPVGFAVFDRVLLTVHPHADCVVRAFFAQRLANQANAGDAAPPKDAGQGAQAAQAAQATQAAQGVQGDLRGNTRLPVSTSDLMLRMLNHMVDSYLDLRRLLTKQLGELQAQLLNPRSQFADWPQLLDSRNSLHVLEDTCEDQRSAVQEWIDAQDELPDEPDPQVRRDRELLRVRARDVLEHIERVLSHVRRLQQSAETAVQMHFSAQSHRTNDIMRTLTVLTAVFLPLNFITGFFGMNFEALPLIHSARGFWVAFTLMIVAGVGLVMYFRRKRYLDTPHR